MAFFKGESELTAGRKTPLIKLNSGQRAKVRRSWEKKSGDRERGRGGVVTELSVGFPSFFSAANRADAFPVTTSRARVVRMCARRFKREARE